MCDHGEDKKSTHIDAFEMADARHEIYMCECGALIDIKAPKNYSDPTHPMTPDELDEVLELLLDASP